MKNRYIEKSTGKWLACGCWFTEHDEKIVRIIEYDDNDRNTEITLKNLSLKKNLFLILGLSQKFV